MVSCQAEAISTKPNQPVIVSAPHRAQIVVTYSVLGSIIKEVAGDQADVKVLMPNGIDPHEWEPSARDIEKINKADLVVENGLGLEGGLDKTFAAAKSQGVKFFTATDYITVRHVGDGEGISGADPDQQSGAPDPHLWMDPLAMKDVVEALVPVLKTGLDLDVSASAAGLADRLESLNDEIKNIVATLPEADRKLVTGHESMGYFAERYNFKLVGVIVPSLSSQAGVAAAELANLKRTIRDNSVKAIFTEVGTSPAVAEAISSETGVKIAEITTHALPKDGSYFTFMTDLANKVVTTLQ